MHPSVRDWLRLSRLHPPLPERSVLELARLIQRWQQHPGGPGQAARAIRKRGQRASALSNAVLPANIWA